MNTTGKEIIVLYLHDKDLNVLDFGGLYGALFHWRSTKYETNKITDGFVEIYGINRKDIIHLDMEDNHCENTEEDVPFGTCLREYIERNVINCSLPKVWGKTVLTGNLNLINLSLFSQNSSLSSRKSGHRYVPPWEEWAMWHTPLTFWSVWYSKWFILRHAPGIWETRVPHYQSLIYKSENLNNLFLIKIAY